MVTLEQLAETVGDLNSRVPKLEEQLGQTQTLLRELEDALKQLERTDVATQAYVDERAGVPKPPSSVKRVGAYPNHVEINGRLVDRLNLRDVNPDMLRVLTWIYWHLHQNRDGVFRFRVNLACERLREYLGEYDPERLLTVLARPGLQKELAYHYLAISTSAHTREVYLVSCGGVKYIDLTTLVEGYDNTQP